MSSEEAETALARRWLAERGVTQTADGAWRPAEPQDPVDTTLTPNEIAHTWADVALREPTLDAAGRLRLGFGLLDLLKEYRVAYEMQSALADVRDPLPATAFWDGYRQRLEAPADARTVTYSLWVDWFEDRATVAEAFAEVLGNDVEELPARLAPHAPARGPLLRRVQRVLEVSGPVPWPLKHAAYRTAATIPDLHPALYKAILFSHHDVYGDLDPTAALAILTTLNLPPSTEHLAPLSAALEAGSPA